MNARRLATYSIFFFLGFFGYYLKYFSFSSVIQQVPHEHYPLILFLQGLISFLTLKYSLLICYYLKRKAVFLIIGVVLLFGYPILFNMLPEGSATGYGLFLLSLMGTSFLQTYFMSSFLNKEDMASEPLFVTKILLFEEVGAFISAFIALKYGFGNYSIPLAAVFIVLLLSSPTPDIKLKQEKAEELQSSYPFGETLVFLFITFMLCKVFYGFLFFESLRSVESSGSPFLEIFSKFSAMEAILSIALLTLKAFGVFNISWPNAFKGFFALTIVTMIFLLFDFDIYMGLLAVGLTKVWQKVVLKDSTHNIFNSLPLKVRLFYWAESEKNSYLISYPILIIVSSTIIFFSVDKVLIAVCLIIFAFIGWFLLRKLIDTITQFHIANMARSDSKGAYVSCLALTVLKSEEHKSALIAMLSRTDDNRLKKAIIQILGQIHDVHSIKTLMDHYQQVKKEDIQLAIVTALVKVSTHEVDLFLLEALQRIINEQTSLGEIRRSLFLRITLRLKDISIPMILKLLKDNSQDHRIIANALIVLGEVGLRRRDRDAFFYIEGYLDAKYSRRIRSNAILYLFQMGGRYRKKAYGVFEEFLTSQEESDKAAAAFLAGELELKGIAPFIWENSVSNNHKNPTLLFSLLKLSYSGVEKIIVEFILSAEKLQAMLALNQLSSINNNHIRFIVYKHVLKLPLEGLTAFIALLKESGRDFDEDLRMLEDEVESRVLLA